MYGFIHMFARTTLKHTHKLSFSLSLSLSLSRTHTHMFKAANVYILTYICKLHFVDAAGSRAIGRKRCNTDCSECNSTVKQTTGRQR